MKPTDTTIGTTVHEVPGDAVWAFRQADVGPCSVLVHLDDDDVAAGLAAAMPFLVPPQVGVSAASVRAAMLARALCELAQVGCDLVAFAQALDAAEAGA